MVTPQAPIVNGLSLIFYIYCLKIQQQCWSQVSCITFKHFLWDPIGRGAIWEHGRVWTINMINCQPLSKFTPQKCGTFDQHCKINPDLGEPDLNALKKTVLMQSNGRWYHTYRWNSYGYTCERNPGTCSHQYHKWTIISYQDVGRTGKIW